MREVSSIANTGAENYITPDHANRDSNLTLDSLALRDEFERAGHQMTDLDKPLTALHDYFSGCSGSSDLSVRTMSRVLPEQLNTALSQQDVFDREISRDVYEELNTLVNESREGAYELLQNQIAQDGIFDGKDLESRTKFINAVFEYIDAGNELSDEATTALSYYSEYSWNLVLLNHRLIYQRGRGIYTLLESYGIEVPMEEVFQQGLLASYKMAATYDPEKSAFPNYISKYSDGRVIRELLMDETLNWTATNSYLKSLTLAEKTLRETEHKGNVEDRNFLTALYYWKLTGVVSFEEEDKLLAMAELKRMYSEHNYTPNKDVLDCKLKGSFRDTYRKFVKRLENIDSLRDMYSLDEDRLVQFRDDQGESEFSYLDSHPILNTDESLRPVEEKVNEALLIDSFKKLTSLDPTERTEDAMSSFLDEKEREVLALHYGLRDGREMSFAEIAERFGLSDARIKQIEDKALRKIRNPYRSRKLRDYL